MFPPTDRGSLASLWGLTSGLGQGRHLIHVTLNLTLCLLSIFLPESIECNAKIELKCYNGLLEKDVDVPRVGTIFAVKSPVKVC